MIGKDILSFYDAFNGEFLVYLGEIQYKLEERNSKYKKVCEDIEDILTRKPKFRKLIENKRQIKISYKESKILLELFDLYFEKKDIVEREVFFSGMREGIWILNKTNLIKDVK
ncbi:MAG: hypothetical protein E7172_06245 [Firmicutes bacterium]|nr:hypothetical protein [Bacillota bacterium]